MDLPSPAPLPSPPTPHLPPPTPPATQGYGTLLMREAESIATREHRSAKIAVISGVGTRHYYRKLGYELEGPYMVKALQPVGRIGGRGRRNKGPNATAAAPAVP
jgi:hypothetical protein